MSKLFMEVRSGLGNQLFQFAFGYALAHEFKKELVLCPSYFDSSWKYFLKKILGREARAFKLLNILKRESDFVIDHAMEQRLSRRDIIVLKENEVDIQQIRSALSSNEDVYLRGYWQHPEFFSMFKEQLGQLIEPTFPLSRLCQKTLTRIDENFVGIHVRRGDFLTNRSFGACRIEYYNQAIRKMTSILGNPKIIVFTNDSAWVNKQFNADVGYEIYVNNSNRNTDVEELYLMTKLNSLIISNSTFSWWGAYLNTTREKRIICPTNWFLKKDLQQNAHNFVSKDWIAIDNELELGN